MKKARMLMFCILVLAFGCKENEPTSPEEGTPTEKAIAEATIGSNGGLLETDDFKLIIPPNAFLTSSDLKLYVEPEKDSFTEFSVSKFFRIDGIPNNLQTPLKISLKYSGTLSGVNFIAVGRLGTITQFDTSFVSVIYDLLETENVDGFLTCEIPVSIVSRNELNKIHNDQVELLISALSKGKNEPVGNHFIKRGVWPTNLDSRVEEIIETFKKAYLRFQDANFDYSGIDKPITLEFIPGDGLTYIHNGYPEDIKPKVNIFSLNSIKNINSLRQDIIAKFLDLVLERSSEYFANNRNLSTLPFTIWARFQYGYKAYYRKSFLQYLINNGYSSDYHPAAYFLQYLSTKYGDSKIAQICNKKKQFELAVVEVMGNPKQNDWLQKFYEYIMTSNSFDDLTNDFFIENSSMIDIINNDMVQSIDDYKVQSSKLNHINLTSTFNENTKLKFNTGTVKSGISIIKYKPYEGNLKREVLKNGYGEVVIPGIKELAESGYNLFALVINNEYEPTGGSNPIVFKIKRDEEIVITGCSVFLRYLTADYIKEYPIGTFTTMSDASLSMGFPKDKPDAEVTFSGRVLTQKYTDYQFTDGYYYSGDITITFGEEDGKINMDYISSITAKWKRAEKLDSREHSDENELSAINIPIDKSVSYLKYKLSGEDVCSENKIVSLNSYENNRTVIYTLINGTWKCNEDSELEVFISTQ